MKEDWAICHGNGVPGQRGASDGYASEAQAAQAAADMAAHGVTVYRVLRVE